MSSARRDATCLMWFDEAGNAIDAAEWTDAQQRIASFLMKGTGNEAWAHGRRLSNLARELGYEIVGGRGSHVVVSRGEHRITLWPPRSRQDFDRQAAKLEKRS